MSHVPEVVIVGPGRLGRSAAELLSKTQTTFVLVGRNEPIPAAPLTWLTVPDASITEVAREVPPGGIVLHASGATDAYVLRPHRPAGSLHPLMTFPGPEITMPTSPMIPAAVAGDPEAIEAASSLARTLGFTPFTVPGDRTLYHAAAVMAGNFATVLLHEASQVLAAAGVPEEDAPALLAPLAMESLRNGALVGPAQALTGPVARGDDAVTARHQAALADTPETTRATYDALLRAALNLRKTTESLE